MLHMQLDKIMTNNLIFHILLNLLKQLYQLTRSLAEFIHSICSKHLFDIIRLFNSCQIVSVKGSPYSFNLHFFNYYPSGFPYIFYLLSLFFFWRSYVRLIYKCCSRQLHNLFTVRSCLTFSILHMAIRSHHGKRKPQLAPCSKHKNQRMVGEMQR